MYRYLAFLLLAMFPVSALISQEIAIPSQEATSAQVQAETADGYPALDDQIYFRDAGYTDPIFVSASCLAKELAQGGIERIRDLFDTLIVHQLERAATDGCADLGHGDENVIPESRRTFKNAVDSADNILVTRVVARSPGFHHGVAGTLLSLETDHILKGFGKSFNRIFVEIGTFDIGDLSICKTSFYYPKLPELGDKVVILFNNDWYNRDSPILSLDGFSGLIVLPPSGPPALSQHYFKSHSALSNTDLEQIITTWISKVRAPKK